MNKSLIAKHYRMFVAALLVTSFSFIVLSMTDSPATRLVLGVVVLATSVSVAVVLTRAFVGGVWGLALEESRPAPAAKLPCPEHLRGSVLERGFGYLPPLPNEYCGPRDISVSEASNAGYAGIWLRVGGLDDRGGKVEATANITAETAWRLAEQLAGLVASHYHGDQRPQPEETILSVDMSRLDFMPAVEDATTIGIEAAR